MELSCGSMHLRMCLASSEALGSKSHLQLSNNPKGLTDNKVGEIDIAEFEKKESEFLSPNDLVGKSGIVLKILDEIQNQRTDFGPKPTGSVEYKEGLATVQKIMRFNQLMINYLIDKTKSKDSKKWIGAEVPIKVDKIKGNNAIVPNKEN